MHLHLLTASIVYALTDLVLSNPVRLTTHSQDHIRSNTSKVWYIPVRNAFQFCGHGCIKFTVGDLLKEVGDINALNSAHLYFYERGELDEETEALESGKKYEVYTINKHGKKHHLVRRFMVTSLEQYKTRWRAANIFHKVLSWIREHSNEHEIKLKFGRVGSEDENNMDFSFDDKTLPFILMGVPDRELDQVETTRKKRSTSSAKCSGSGDNQQCCYEEFDVNLDTAGLYRFWIAPRIFTLRQCSGRCEDKGAEIFYTAILNQYNRPKSKRCCRPVYDNNFSIRYYTESDGVLTNRLVNFKVDSCRCD